MGAFFKKTLAFLGLAEEENDQPQSDDISYANDTLYKSDYVKGKSYLYNDDINNNETSGRFSSNLRNLQFTEDGTKKIWSSSRNSRKLLSIDGAKDSKKIKVSVAEPHEFEEVQNIGDDLKLDIPVIVNLQNTNSDLSKRIIDFCSGLTYALEGSIKKVADRVFLITPKNTVVTSNNEKEILREKGLYNQL